MRTASPGVCLIMSTLRDVETLLLKLSRAEKAQVLQWVVRDLGDALKPSCWSAIPL